MDVSGTCTITKPGAAQDHFRSLQLLHAPHLQQKKLTRSVMYGSELLASSQQQDEHKGDKVPRKEEGATLLFSRRAPEHVHPDINGETRAKIRSRLGSIFDRAINQLIEICAGDR
jgi:hypothetical protein